MAYSTHILATHTAEPARLSKAVAALKSAWQGYRQRRAQRSTVLLLQSLDDMSLRDVGMNRSEIESVVYAPPVERRRTYHGGSCW